MTSVSGTASGAPDTEEDFKMIDSIDGAESCQESDEEENAAEIEYRKVRQQYAYHETSFFIELSAD